MNLRGCNKRDNPRRHAFTRIDLAVLILIVGFSAAFAAPLFTSHSRVRFDTLMCQANLAEIGRGYQIWAGDHEDWNPWFVDVSEGGLRQHPLAANAYIQFSCISNGVTSPKVFVCPADTNTTRRAKNFSTSPDGGFMHPGYRNNAISYMVGFHAFRYAPRSILSGDRNTEPFQSTSCSFVPFPIQTIQRLGPGGSQWGESIHGSKGNLLFNDGSVEKTTNEQLREAVWDSDGTPARNVHVLLPK